MNAGDEAVTVYYWSRRATRYAHIKTEPGNEWKQRNGRPRSHASCGICDFSRVGDWQQATHQSAIPMHLTLCPRCLSSPRCPKVVP